MLYPYITEMIEKANISLRARGKVHHLPGYEDTRHILDFDMLYTASGQNCFNIDGKEYVSNPGDVHIVAPGSLLVVRCREESEQYYCHFMIETQEKHELTGEFEDNTLPGEFCGIMQLYKKYFEISDNPENSGASEISIILKLFLIEMLRANDNNKVCFVSGEQHMKPEKVFEILHYIHGNLGRNITVESLAETAGFNPSYFSRYFKKYVGMSPMRYINEQKMNFAKHFILTSDKSIKEIADELGFADQFAFSKKFKESFGISPSEFRKIKI